MLVMLRLQGLYWTLPRDRVEELEDGDSEEDEEEEPDEASAASLVEGAVHSDKPESGGGERGQALVRSCLCGVLPCILGPEHDGAHFTCKGGLEA